MKNIFRILLSLMMLSFFMAGGVSASVEWQTGGSIKTGQPPIDLAVSADGKYTFVLTKGGELKIYTANGSLTDTISISAEFDTVATDGSGSRVYLGNSKKSTVQEIRITYRAKFSEVDSPFLGKSDAPVVMAVFSDFQ
jgi:DNA-binding beta-propeller fold protein YncE